MVDLEFDPRVSAASTRRPWWLVRDRDSLLVFARAVLWAAVAAVLAYAAYRAMYTTYEPYDDTGKWAIGVSAFIHHGDLYASTFGIAGPFYYEFWAAVYALTGAHVDPDSAVLTSLVAWILTSVLIGVAVRNLTRRTALGLLATLASFILLEVNSAEALEPAHLSYVLVAALLVGVGAWPRLGERGQRLGAVACGVLCALMVLTKVNIGAFTSCGVCFAAAVYWPSHRVRLVLRPVACIGLLLVPVVLMRTGLQGITLLFFRPLFMLIEVSLLALVAFAFTVDREAKPFKQVDVWMAMVAAAVTVAIVWIVVIADGTPPLRFITDGVFGQADLIKLFSRNPPYPGGAFTLAEYSTGAAILTAALTGGWLRGWRPRWILDSAPVAFMRLAVGLWILLTCIPYWYYKVSLPIWFASFAVAVPLCWVGLLERSAQEEAGLHFARMLIVTIGCLGCLEVYPVAGSQESWASLLLVPVALICIWDGIEVLRGARWIHRLVYVPLTWMAVLGAGAFLVDQQAWPAMRVAHEAYATGVSPALPGGSKYRLAPGVVAALQKTTTTLDHRCSTFVTSPGLFSFYFFTQMKPPTNLHATQWRKELSPRQQRTIVDAIRHVPNACVVSSKAMNVFWYPPPFPVPPSPLYRYIRRNFVPVGTNWIYTVEVRRAANESSH